MVRFGRGIRALRLRRRWHQVDLAAAARVSQSVIARIELGLGGRMTVEILARVAGALGARIDIRLNWQGEGLDRLLDQDHAELVEIVAGLLRASGREARTEVTFAIRGERGSVAARPARAADGGVRPARAARGRRARHKDRRGPSRELRRDRRRGAKHYIAARSRAQWEAPTLRRLPRGRAVPR